MPENDKSRLVIEILLGAIFLVLLIMLVVLFIELDNKSTPDTASKSDVIVISQTPTIIRQKYCNIVKIPSKTYYKYSYAYEYSDKDYNALNFKVRSEHARSYGVFDNQIDRYYVYVKNTDNNPGYFTVKFSFEDWNGYKKVEKSTKYIKPGEERQFSHHTTYGDRITDWDYEVISETKDPDSDYHKTYYNIQRETPIVTKYRTEYRCYYT